VQGRNSAASLSAKVTSVHIAWGSKGAGLQGVREAAKGRKQEKFTALLHHMNVDLLRESFYALRRQAATGVDGVTRKEYETGLEDRLIDLHSRVHRGAYRVQPSRRVYILKADGRQTGGGDYSQCNL
jgi:RNA-directed DNA polymerase